MGRMPRFLLVPAPAVLAAFAACFGRGGTHPNTADISGAWQYTEAFTDLTDGISCADTGTYQMVQNGTTFTGTYAQRGDRKSTRLNSSHLVISYAVFCLKKKKENLL